MTDRHLRRLAQAYHVAVEYRDWRDQRVSVAPDTLRAVLGALGVDASTSAAVRDSLAERQAGPSRLPPVSVVRFGYPVRVPAGSEVVGYGRIAADGRLPDSVPLGWHTLQTPDGQTGALAYVPEVVALPSGMRGRRLTGLLAQLYSIRSAASWGIGDLVDLAELADYAGRLGVGFTMVNPMHATEPTAPVTDSPYLPVSRRFASPLYLRIERVPEYRRLPATDREAIDALAAPLRAAQRTNALIDRDAVWTAKRQALHLLYRAGLSDRRREEYLAFCHREGQALTDFATWCALAEAYGPRWRRWPRGLRDPRSAQVAAEARRLADRVEFHRWAQWLLDEQLSAAQQAALDAGMPLGILHDLAVGVAPDGADVWMHRDVYVDGVTVGTPPDEFNRHGQNWNQLPWHPGRLAAAGYAPFRDMVRFWLRHSGGLRIDHVMGLFRLWWVPDGATPRDGTYVGYDHEAMVGILGLEAHLADAVVVGEDLGTVEPWIRRYLQSRGILGTSVLWFESDKGAPRPPHRWRRDCLATVDTHDLPPVAGYVTGEFIDVKHRRNALGQDPAQAKAELATRVAAWRGALMSMGLLPASHTSMEALVRGLHAYLARTPATLVGLSVPNLVGERRSQNLPGTYREYPNWRIPLADHTGRAVLLDEVISDPRVAGHIRAAVAAIASDG